MYLEKWCGDLFYWTRFLNYEVNLFKSLDRNLEKWCSDLFYWTRFLNYEVNLFKSLDRHVS